MEVNRFDGHIARMSRMDPGLAERITDAGMREFCNGYRLSSTDAVAQKAGISKGLLFHYFGTKLNLLWFLLRSAAASIRSELVPRFDLGERDLLNRLLQTTYAILEFRCAHPATLDFITAISRSSEPILADARQWLRDNIGDVPPEDVLLPDGEAPSCFRPDIHPGDAVRAIRHAMTAFTDSELAREVPGESDWERTARVMEGLQRYVNLFRRAFYPQHNP